MSETVFAQGTNQARIALRHTNSKKMLPVVEQNQSRICTMSDKAATK